MDKNLHDYGFVPFFVQQTSLDEIECGRVARVTEVQRSHITVSNGTEEQLIALTPSWHTAAPEFKPTVGDWVVLNDQCSTLERVLDRKSLFRRVAPGDKSEVQIIAANIDILFIVTSCNEEFKESRLERYLALALEAGVIPVVVLTKIDCSDDPGAYVERARSIQPDLHVESVNALDRNTFTGILAWIEPGSTVALVGSSGVGKSTLLNTLAGAEVTATNSIREDDKKGRHTTSYRALHQLPDGGLLIDVPGMRELKVAEVDEALATLFDDIETRASQCKFANCCHETEPECAVRAAIENGEIDERRLQNYLKLMRENERNTASLAEKRSQDRAFTKHVKQVMASKKQEQKTTR